MKRFSVVVIIFLFGCSGFQQTLAQPQDPVQAIRQQYASINRSAAKYRKVKKELLGFSAEGGELVAYFKGPQIMKIVATFFGESGRTIEEYYYSGGTLIFVFRRELHYDRPLSGKVVATAENRFYFKDDKLIRWIDENGKQVSTTAPEFAEGEARLLASSKQFIEGARWKNPTIEDR